MKKKFSTAWKGSKQPRKQRKYAANAPIHIKRKMLSVSLSKDLRKKYGKRNVPVRKGDSVLITTGKFKKQKGKVIEVKIKLGKIYIEKIQKKKQDGSMVNVPIRASNLRIIELDLNDKKRAARIGVKRTSTSENAEKKETKETKKPVKEKKSKEEQK